MKPKIATLFLLLMSFPSVISQNLTADPSFGTVGVAITQPSDGFTEGVYDCLISPINGKIICSGSISVASTPTMPATGVPHLTIRQYNTDGTVDTGFGNNGMVETSLVYIKTYSEEPYSLNVTSNIKVLSNGQILIVGGAGNYDYGISRFNANGTLDTTFGINGTASIDLGPLNLTGSSVSSYDCAAALGVQADNKIVVTGGKVNAKSIYTVRFNENGTIDTAFGVSGVANYTIDATMMNAGNVVQFQSDGKILICGMAGAHLNFAIDMGILRLNTDGSLDTTFANNGVYKAPTNNASSYPTSLLVTEDDKIFLGAYAMSRTFIPQTISGVKAVLIKLNSNGSPDTSFGNNGVYFGSLTQTGIDEYYDITLQADGKILLVGRSEISSTSCSIVSRMNANGTRDTSFFSVGYLKITHEDASSTRSRAIAIQADSKIVIASNPYYRITPQSGLSKIALNRYVLGALGTSTFDSQSFSIAPNPFTDKVSLTFNLDSSEVLYVDLFDNNGRKIQNLIQDKTFSAGNNTTEIQMPESLSKGVYLIKIFNGSTNTTLKIIK